jgi:hypothetical protein
MSNELRLNYAPSRTITARIVDEEGRFWNTATRQLETYGSGSYAIAVVDKGGGVYRSSFPAACTTPAVYTALFFDTETSTTDPLGQQTIVWDGGKEVSLESSILTAAFLESSIAAPGEVEVVNFALGLLGGAANATYPWLDSLDEDSADEKSLPAVRWCQIMYPRARDKMQAAWDWPEVMRFAKMGTYLSDASALTVPGWEYLYSRPSACLAFRGLVSNSVNEITGEWIEYPYLEVGTQIASNVENDDDDPSYLFRYNVRVTDVTKWSEGLLQVTAHLLAVYLARPMGVNQEGQTYLKQLYKIAFDEARAECQKRVFVPGRLAQTGESIEMAPGVLDFNWPQPE